ncbi:TonB-dependent receptor domain-containing protein [Kordiimonas aestuarii]|uniref:TonB-dependent receptor domain-containing protein n=1 Tax=Kordiimonas aestuarii TaxID=1005925 RepID=UPI0021CFE016|nr:TonB-dependent receptor [Kordiimonas aestuarii]
MGMKGLLTAVSALALIGNGAIADSANSANGDDGAVTEPAPVIDTLPDVGTAQESYTADFFEPYAPQNAYDMIQRLPGFVYSTGSEARGFGGTAGNVLIDSARPTSKSGGLTEALRRIPAAQVMRIELQRGAMAAGEAAGQTVVANVIRYKNKSSGTWTVETRRVGNNKILPMLDATFATKLMGWDASFQLDTFIKSTDRDAVISRVDADGTLLNKMTEDRQEEERFGALSFDAGRDAFGGRLQLNGRMKYFAWHGDTSRLGYGTSGLDTRAQDRFFNDHDEEEYGGELGADWSRTYASGWKWRLIALGTFEDETNTDNFLSEAPLRNATEVGDITSKEKSTETILRTTYGLTQGTLRPEFGVEGAYNRLDSTLAILIVDGSGMTTEDMPASTVRVAELRAETFGNLVWQASTKLTADVGAKAEVSRISTRGGTEQTFTFLKPSAGLNYTVSDHVQVSVKAERSVGQLDFSDFAASADAVDDRQFVGNPNLKPDRTDRLQAKLDYTFGERGAISTTVFYEWKDDVLEQTILPSGGQGLANAGSAKRWGMNANANLPLDFALEGGLLEIDVYLKDSAFEDPLTGQTRYLHDFTPSEVYIDFRHDIPDTNWAWGLEYNSAYHWHGYYINEHEDFRGNNRYGAFIETTEFFGVKTSLILYDVFGGDFDRLRELYDPTRGGASIGTELSERTRDTGVRFVVSGQF